PPPLNSTLFPYTTLFRSSNPCKFLRICIAGSLWPIFLDELSSGHYDYYVSFIRRSRRGKFTYLAEVESVRVEKRVVQRFIRYIGREEDGKTVLRGLSKRSAFCAF